MPSIDERHDALRESVELLLIESREHTVQIREQTVQILEHSKQLAIDAENIRALARIAESHESRLSDIEGLQ